MFHLNHGGKPSPMPPAFPPAQLAPEDVRRKFPSAHQEITAWVRGWGEEWLKKQGNTEPHSLQEAEEARKAFEKMELKSMKPLSLFREVVTWKVYEDLKSDVTQLEAAVQSFVQKMHNRRTQITSLYSFFRQLAEVERQEHAVRQVVGEDAAQVQGLSRQQLRRRMQCLHQAMKRLLAAIQRCDMEVENLSGLGLHKGMEGSRSTQGFMREAVESHKHASNVLMSEVRRQLEVLKRESRFLVLQSEVEHGVEDLQKYGTQVAEAYTMLGVGKTPVEARLYLEEIMRKRDRIKTTSEKCQASLEKYMSLCLSEQRPLSQAKRWENQAKFVSQELMRGVDELVLRLKAAFTIYATLDALLNQTEELLLLVLEEQQQSPKKSQGPSRTKHIAEQSEHIWSEFLNAEKESLSMLQRLERPLLAQETFPVTVNGPEPSRNSIPDVASVKEATELTIKMKLFTLWVKLQELLRLSPATQALRERVQKATINLATGSAQEEEILKRNLKSHLNEFQRRMELYLRRWSREPLPGEVALLQDSVREMIRIEDEVASMWTSLARELAAVRDLGTEGSNSSRHQTLPTNSAGKDSRVDLATSMHREAESQYHHFSSVRRERADRLKKKLSILEILAEVATLFQKDEDTLEQMLREFHQYRLKGDYQRRTIAALQSRLPVHEKNLEDLGSNEALHEFTDVRSKFLQLRQDFAAYVQRLAKFRDIVATLDLIRQLSKEVYQLQEQWKLQLPSSKSQGVSTWASTWLRQVESLQARVRAIDEPRLSDQSYQLWGSNAPLAEELEDWHQARITLDNLGKMGREMLQSRDEELETPKKSTRVQMESRGLDFDSSEFRTEKTTRWNEKDVKGSREFEVSERSERIETPNVLTQVIELPKKHAPPKKSTLQLTRVSMNNVEVEENSRLIIQCSFVPVGGSLENAQSCVEKALWYRNGALLSLVRPSPWVASILQNRVTISKSKAEVGDSGDYQVELFHSPDDDEPIAMAQARVQVTPCGAPSGKNLVQRPLQDQTLHVGETLRLQCFLEPSEKDPTVSWERNGYSVTPNSRRTESLSSNVASLEIKEVTVHDGGRYTCLVKSSSPKVSEQRSSYTVHVLAPPRFLQKFKPEVQLAVGERLNLQCQVESQPPAVVTWMHNDVPLKGGDEDIVSSRVVIQKAADCHTLTIRKVAPEDAGVYKCVAENTLGSSELHSSLVVHGSHAPPRFTKFLPTVTEVSAGGNLRLSASFPSEGAKEVNWYYNGRPVKGRPGVRILVFPDHSTLTIDQVRTQDAGIYELEVRSPRGNEKTQTQVRVKPLENEVDVGSSSHTTNTNVITTNKETSSKTSTNRSERTIEGTSWRVEEFDFIQEETCLASVDTEAHFTICLNAPEEVTWYLNGRRIDPTEDPENAPQTLTLRNQHGHDVFSLIIHKVTNQHHGNRYSVVTKKSGQKVLTTFKLEVSEDVTGGSEENVQGKTVIQFRKTIPGQDMHPDSFHKSDSLKTSSKSFSELITSSSEQQRTSLLSTQTTRDLNWQHKDHFHNTDSFQPSSKFLNDLVTSNSEQTNTRTATEVHHHHHYHPPTSPGGVIRNSSSEVVVPVPRSSTPTNRTNMIVSHTRNLLHMAPEFLGVFHDAVVSHGDTVVLHCKLRGVPTPDVWWSFNGNTVPNPPLCSRWQIHSDGEEYTFTIRDVCSEDSGRFSFTAENEIGLAGCSAILIVRDEREPRGGGDYAHSECREPEEHATSAHSHNRSPRSAQQYESSADRRSRLRSRESSTSRGAAPTSRSQSRDASHRSPQVVLVASPVGQHSNVINSTWPDSGATAGHEPTSSIGHRRARSHYPSEDLQAASIGLNAKESSTPAETSIFLLSPAGSGRFREEQRRFTRGGGSWRGTRPEGPTM